MRLKHDPTHQLKKGWPRQPDETMTTKSPKPSDEAPAGQSLVCAKAVAWDMVYPAIVFLIEAHNLPPSGWETLKKAVRHVAEAHNAGTRRQQPGCADGIQTKPKEAGT